MDATHFLNDIPRSIAQAAHDGTSWIPERRAESEINEYASTLAADWQLFEQNARKGGTLDKLPEEFARYRAGYQKRTRAYLHSRSGMVSWMIAGPSNFPVARQRKKADIVHRRLSELIDWRARARSAVIRNLRPDLKPIMAGDADALDRLDADIEKAERGQVIMREANKIVRAWYKAGLRDPSGDGWARYHAQLCELDPLFASERKAAELLQPDCLRRIGFPDYALTNNGANIRRMKQRRGQIARNHATPAQTIETESGITLEDDPPGNRVRLYFPGKPPEAVRAALKRNGFRWTPTLGAWQAYRNPHSIEHARQVSGAKGAA